MNKLVITEIENLSTGKRVNCEVDVREYSIQGNFVSMFVVGDVQFNINDELNMTFKFGGNNEYWETNNWSTKSS